MADRVKGKIAIVTGAAMGLGRAIAARLAEEGATVVLTDINEEAGRLTAEAITASGGAAEFLHHDVTSEQEWQQVMDQVMTRHGRLDILVNNAGVSLLKSVMELTLQEFQRVNRINAYGTFLGNKHGVAAMRQSGGSGSIINISSILGQVGARNNSAYAAGKGAVRLMTKALALEVGAAREMIRVNSVHPGLIRTPMTENLFGQDVWSQGDDKLFSPTLLKAGGEPRDIAEGVLFLASDDAEYVTGTELTIDGGWTAV